MNLINPFKKFVLERVADLAPNASVYMDILKRENFSESALKQVAAFYDDDARDFYTQGFMDALSLIG